MKFATQGVLLFFVFLAIVAVWLGGRWWIANAQGCSGSYVLAEGLLTAFSVSNDITAGGGCVTGGGAYLPVNQAKIFVGDYQSLYNKYYDRNNVATFTKHDFPANNSYDTGNSALPGSGNRMFHGLGNLTIQNALKDSNSGDILVFFVEGNLYIAKDILQGENSSLGGVVFVVKGNINIAETVGEINAVLIAQGVICTACNESGLKTSRYPNNVPPYDNQLQIFGSLISLGQSNSILFARFLQDNRIPAELVSAQAKYLVILRRVFDEKLKIYREL